MEGRHTIKVLIMEDKDSKRSILNLLTDFTTENKIELLFFNDENKLYKHLKENKKYLGDNVHNIVLFHSDEALRSIIKVVEKIKSDPELKITPVFIITSSVDNKDVLEAYKCHLNCFIAKTDDVEGLIGILNSFKDFWFNIVRLP